MNDVNAAAALISTVVPQIGAAYQLYRLIWLQTNPGKTEADYLQHLADASKQTIGDADAVLTGLGYTQDATGAWHKAPASS